jgi:chromosome segregation ATPase
VLLKTRESFSEDALAAFNKTMDDWRRLYGELANARARAAERIAALEKRCDALREEAEALSDTHELLASLYAVRRPDL